LVAAAGGNDKKHNNQPQERRGSSKEEGSSNDEGRVDESMEEEGQMMVDGPTSLIHQIYNNQPLTGAAKAGIGWWRVTRPVAVEKNNNQLREGGEEEDCICRKKRWRLWRSGDGWATQQSATREGDKVEAAVSGAGFEDNDGGNDDNTGQMMTGQALWWGWCW
jgi:hypothetical protein